MCDRASRTVAVSLIFAVGYAGTIGGMGTLYGALIGSVLFVLAQSYLQDLLRLAGEATTGIPLLPALLTPDRWLLWLGLLFVLSVYYFPTCIVGKLRERAVLARLKGLK